MGALEAADAGATFDRSRGTQRSHVTAIRQWALLGLGRRNELLEADDALVTCATPLGDRWTVRYRPNADARGFFVANQRGNLAAPTVVRGGT